TQPGQEWQGLGLTIPGFREGKPVNSSVQTWGELLKSLRDGRTLTFNAEVADYRRALDTTPPAGAEKVDFETFFNRFDPFTVSLVLYVGVALFAVVSWLGLPR